MLESNMELEMLIDAINPEINSYANDRFQAMTKLLALEHTNNNIVKALENAAQNDPAGKIRELASQTLKKHKNLLALENPEFRKRNYR